MKYSVVIATYNRALELSPTLRSMAGLAPRDSWELVVVDNNSTDDTRRVVEEAAADCGAPVHYVFERVQGKPAALNAGIRSARGTFVVMTDDDVRVPPDWLDRIGAAFDRFRCDFLGGKVLPIWSGVPPKWLPTRPGRQWGVLPILDYGGAPLPAGQRGGAGWPLGANMACTRQALEIVGAWDNRFGRRGRTLLGQEQRDWCLRARAAGLRGYYVPDVVVSHVISANRLTKAYFRRWNYWYGISRAVLYEKWGLDMDSPDDSRLDFSHVPHVGRIPRYMFRVAAEQGSRMVAAFALGNRSECFERELWLWFFAGIVSERWTRRAALRAQP